MDDDLREFVEEIEARNAGDGDDTAAYEQAREEVEAEQREKSKFDLIEEEWKEELERVKAQTKKPRNRSKQGETDAISIYNGEIETLSERMTDAWIDDKKANQAGKLAVSKLKLLPEVIAMLHRRNPANSVENQLDKDDPDRPIVNKNFLKACQYWLQPLPDGTLPSLKIREGILKNLHKLEVDSQVLIESQIGAAVLNLLKNKTETPANKKICKALVSKWSRPVFNVPTNYSALKRIEPLHEQPIQKRPRLSSSGGSASQMDSLVEGKLLRTPAEQEKANEVWYPRRYGGDQIRRPAAPELKSQGEKDEEEEEKKPSESATAKAIREKMNLMAKSRQSGGGVRAYSVKLNSLPRLHERK